jgi:riboflavin synthase
MFTGIIEATSSLTEISPLPHLVRIRVKRPQQFSPLKGGDSIAVNGFCLTVEEFDEKTMQFALGWETLNILKLGSNFSANLDPSLNSNLSDRSLGSDDMRFLVERALGGVNLERSLSFGDRVHGHLVTGHVDTRVPLLERHILGESWVLTFQLPKIWHPYLWPKGSCALNGVSLTLNEVNSENFSVCLIPETLKRTQFSQIEVGDWVNLEVDPFARGLVHHLKNLSFQNCYHQESFNVGKTNLGDSPQNRKGVV